MDLASDSALIPCFRSGVPNLCNKSDFWRDIKVPCTRRFYRCSRCFVYEIRRDQGYRHLRIICIQRYAEVFLLSLGFITHSPALGSDDGTIKVGT